MGRALPLAALVVFLIVFWEDHLSVRGLQLQGLEDLPFCIHAAVHSSLDAIDGESGDSGPSRQLRFAHHPFHSKLSNVVRRDFLGC